MYKSLQTIKKYARQCVKLHKNYEEKSYKMLHNHTNRYENGVFCGKKLQNVRNYSFCMLTEMHKRFIIFV